MADIMFVVTEIVSAHVLLQARNLINAIVHSSKSKMQKGSGNDQK
jgi:hypothetical protein